MFVFVSVSHVFSLCSQALVIPEKFQHILRVLNTNIDGKQKIMFALTSIKVSKIILRHVLDKCMCIMYGLHRGIERFFKLILCPAYKFAVDHLKRSIISPSRHVFCYDTTVCFWYICCNDLNM